MPRALPFLLALMALSACGPAAKPTDARAAAYQADAETCEGSVPDAVKKRNAKTGLAWFASPVTRWSQISEGVSACMDAKGWGRTRTCTAEELRTGRNRTVTADGVRCTDPATRP